MQSLPSPLNPGRHGPQVALTPGAGTSVQFTPAAQGDCRHPSASSSQKRPVHAVYAHKILEGCTLVLIRQIILTTHAVTHILHAYYLDCINSSLARD